MSNNIQDYVELLNAEQHVQVDKLREYARHGITPRVRGEVWMYLLRVLSADRTSEITSIINLNTSYQSLPSTLAPHLQGLLTREAVQHHTRRFDNPTYAGLISSITSEGLDTTGAGPGVGASGISGDAAGGSGAGGRSRTTTGGSLISQGTDQAATRSTSTTRGKDESSTGEPAPHPHSRDHSRSSLLRDIRAYPSQSHKQSDQSRLHHRDYSETSSRHSDDRSTNHSGSRHTGTGHGAGPSSSGLLSHNNHLGKGDHRSDRGDKMEGGATRDRDRGESSDRGMGGVPGAGASGDSKGQRDSEDGAPTTLRSQVSRFIPPPPTTPPTRQAFLSTLTEVLGKYYNSQLAKGKTTDSRRVQSGFEDGESHWVYLATPFVCCLSRPIAMYLGFEKLLERMETFPPLPSQLATLLTLFRQAIPELFSYFEDEQVPYVKVAMSWLRTLLSREMWLGDVLRLWDAYFASDDMFALHCYVCVSVLGTCKETLEELDGSEAKLMLLDLPPMDVDRLLQDAANLRVSFPLPVAVTADEA